MTTLQVLKLMKVISWIFFIGLCIQTGALIISYLISFNTSATGLFYEGMDFSDLYSYGILSYTIVIGCLILISVLKAWIFYLILKISSESNIQFPFTSTTAALISHISLVALIVGLLSIAGFAYSNWLVSVGVDLPMSILDHHFDGRHVFILLAAVIFVLAQVFKRGVEIQSENELTI